MELVKAGRYTAKVSEHAITKTKAGLPQATVVFAFDYDGGERRLTWYGSFKDTAAEHTIKALVNCGLQGNNPADPLEIGKEVSITVEVDEGQNGNPRNTIRWVNALGGIKEAVDSGEARAALEKFSGAVMAYRQKAGVTKSAPKNHAPESDKMPWE